MAKSHTVMMVEPYEMMAEDVLIQWIQSLGVRIERQMIFIKIQHQNSEMALSFVVLLRPLTMAVGRFVE